MLNPTISLANIGIDENVFNESTSPKRDFTMTLSPKTDWWLPFAGTWFNGVVSEDLVWYDRYSSVLQSPTESPFPFSRIGGLNYRDSLSSVATHCL